MGLFRNLAAIAFAGAFAVLMPGNATAQLGCRLCAPGTNDIKTTEPETEPGQPLHIEVETSLDFSRIAQGDGSGGDVTIDSKSGARRVAGSLLDLGGLALRGTVRLKGEANRLVRVDLPREVQLRSANGAVATVYNIETDLSPSPKLGIDGTLSFSFGGKLSIKGQSSGSFRGSIPITADYQ